MSLTFSWVQKLTTNLTALVLLCQYGRVGTVTFAQSTYFTLFYESLVLAQRGGRVSMSMDQIVLRVFAQYVPVSDVNTYIHHFFPAIYPKICKFFVKAAVFGGDIDAEYVLNEYDKHVLGQTSYFKNCQEALTLSPTTYQQVLQVCATIATRPVITEGDYQVIEFLLRKLFGMLEIRAALLVLKQLFMMSTDSELRTRAQDVFKTIHPLYGYYE